MSRSALRAGYSQEVVDILHRATVIAKPDESAKIGIDRLLAAFASEKRSVMLQLQKCYGISSASWRAAAARLRQPEKAKPISPRLEADAVPAREYLSPEEAAIELGIHVQTLRTYVRSGKLPARPARNYSGSVTERRRPRQALLRGTDHRGPASPLDPQFLFAGNRADSLLFRIREQDCRGRGEQSRAHSFHADSGSG